MYTVGMTFCALLICAILVVVPFFMQPLQIRQFKTVLTGLPIELCTSVTQ